MTTRKSLGFILAGAYLLFMGVIFNFHLAGAYVYNPTSNSTSSGGGSSTTTINGVNGPTFVFATSTPLSIVASGTTFTFSDKAPSNTSSLYYFDSSGNFAPLAPQVYWTKENVAIAGTTGAPSLGQANFFGPISIGPRAIQFKHITYDITSTSTGSIDMGLYDYAGNLVANIGSSTPATTGVFSATTTQGTVTILPGLYWVSIMGNSTTSWRWGAWTQGYGMSQGNGGSSSTAAGNLPATTTITGLVVTAQAAIPSFALTP